MTTYKELKNQIEKLQRKAEQARQLEMENAIGQVRTIMQEYGITAEDLGFVSRKMPGTRRPVPPRYRNNATGETWSGRGKLPRWMAGKDKEQFLIK